MKNWFIKHRPLWISILIVAAAAVLTVGYIVGTVISVAEAEQVETLAESKGTLRNETAPSPSASQSETVPAQTEQEKQKAEPAPQTQNGDAAKEHVNSTELANRIRHAIEYADARRLGLIPYTSFVFHAAYGLPGFQNWRAQGTIVSEKAIDRAKAIVSDLFGAAMEEPVRVFGYVDPSGLRNTIVQVRDRYDQYIVTLDFDSLELINADTTRTDGLEFDVTSDELAEAERITNAHVASFFGVPDGKATRVKEVLYNRQTDEHFETGEFQLALADGRIVRIGTAYGKLACVGVYPDQDCANECVYYPADCRNPKSKYTEKVYDETEFLEVTPRELEAHNPKNSKAEQIEAYVKALYRFCMGKEYQGEVMLRAYLDATGVREDYWVVSLRDGITTMTVTAQSGKVVELTGNLRNPNGDVPPADVRDFEGKNFDLIGEAYVAYVRELAPYFCALSDSPFKNVEINAIADGVVVTIDIYLENGVIYELFFRNGVWVSVDFFKSNTAMWYYDKEPWEADQTYRNTVSGEEYIYYQDYFDN